MKKILATILALVLAIGVTTMAWATETAAEKVAKVGETEYATLQEAVNAADGKTVQLLQDVTASITIESGKTVTLDLNGKTLTNEDGKHTITNNGTLTIIGTGTVDNVTHQRAAIVNNGTATLNGGTYTRSKENSDNNKEDAKGNSFYTILSDNGATMTINEGVTVTNVGHFSSMICNGGTSASTSTMIINGGTFNGGLNAIKNDEAGVLTINGGDFSNTSQFVVMNWHKTTINGGSFKAQSSAEAVLFTAKYAENTAVGELTIKNGTFERAADTQKMLEVTYKGENGNVLYTGTAAIYSGVFAGDVSAYATEGTAVASLKGVYYVGAANIESAVNSMSGGDTLTVIKGSVKVGNTEYGANKTYTKPTSYYYYSPSTTTPDTSTKGSPKTFDAGVGIYAVTAVLSVTGMAWTAKKRH
nr:MAG TPA: hyaluronidase [Bacteriophage sp.]